MTPGPLPDKWYSRDFPVLIEVVRRMDTDGRSFSATDLPKPLGMTNDEVQAALRALISRGYVDAAVSKALNGPPVVVAVREVAGEAYVLTGLHPSDDDVAALAALFEAAAEQSSDPAERSKLQALATGARSVSSDVLKRVLAAYIASRIPG